MIRPQVSTNDTLTYASPITANSLRNLDEKDLLTELQNGSDAAFQLLHEREADKLYSVAYRMVNNDNDANDVVQNAFMSAYKAIGRFKGESKLSTWLHRITVNESLMLLRKRKRNREINLSRMQSNDSDQDMSLNLFGQSDELADAASIQEESFNHLHEQIEQLPVNYREILKLRDIQELNTQETAEMLGVSVNVVKTRLHRARQALKALLDPTLADMN